MVKYLALTLGCGLAFSLAACAPPAAEQPQAEAPQTQPATSEAQTPENRPAQNRPGQNQDGERRTPPDFVYEACTGLEAQAACSFETPRGETRSGTCRTRQGEDRAICAVAPSEGQRQGAMGEGAMGDRGMGDRGMGDRPAEE